MILRRISLLANTCEKPEYVAPVAKNITYNGNSQELLTAGSTNDGTIYYSIDDSTWGVAVPSGINAGSYTVYWKLVANEGYCDIRSEINVTIAKLTPTVVAPTAKVLTYNGSAQELVNAGSTDYGTLQYKVSSDSWTTSIPTRTRGGSYTVQYRVVGDSNINDVAAQSVQCSINEKQVTATVTLSQTAYTYNGSACEPSVTVSDGGVVIDPSEYTVTYSNNINAGTGTVTISDNVGGDYEVIGSSTFTINKANSSLSFTVTNITIEVGETSSNVVTVNAGDGTVTYSSNDTSVVAVDNNGSITGVSVGNATITANISSTNNYNSASTSYTSSCVETRVVAKFNVTSTSSPTRIASAATTNFSKIEIDGVEQPSVVSAYTFNTTGEHTVKYTLKGTSIGNSAFRDCIGLTSIDIPDSVTSIGNSVFWGCTSLSSCTIGSGVTSIGNDAFYDCSGLTSITVEATTPPTLGNSAFYSTNNCPIYVPCDSVDTYKAANNWSSYSSRIQANLETCWDIFAKFNVTDTSTPTKILYSTTNVSKVYIDGVEQPSVTTGYTFSTTGEHIVGYDLEYNNIRDNAFSGCTSLTSCIIGNGVTGISGYAFRYCSGLTSMVIPDSVTSIGTSAFEKCSGLTSINIPSGVTTINEHTFQNCISLTSITIPNSVTSIGSYSFSGCTSLTNCTIGSSVTDIGDRAFYYCSGLTSIVIPDSVTSIGSYAFYGCRNATDLIIGNGNNVEIWNNAFQNCISLSSCTIGSGVTSIGGQAFYNCSGLTSIVIPNSVTSIGGSAFTDCTRLTSINIPSGVTTINDYTFLRCSDLTSIDILDSVTSIGNCAFYDCYSLTSCTIGSGVTSIGYSAFTYCTSLPSITIPNSVTSIGSSAFGNCSSLTSCTIGSGVTSIDDGAFEYCSSLTSIGPVGSGASVEIPNNVTSIKEDAFNRCTGLTTVTIPGSITSIGKSAFEGCWSLSNCTIGSGVTSIGTSAFYACYGLTSIDIPNSVTSIGTYAFFDCESLINITSSAVAAPTIQSSTFQGVHTNGTLIVPTSSTGYDVWLGTGRYYLGYYNWTKIEMPSGYKICEYIGNQGAAYINTNITLDFTETIKIKISVSDYKTQWGGILGNYHNEDSNCTRIIQNNSNPNKALVFFNNKTSGGGKSVNINGLDQINTYEISSSSVIVNGTNTGVPSSTQGDSFNASIKLFTYTPKYSIVDGKLYSFSISGKCNMIPCISPSNVVGLYDTVRNQFFSSANSTAFVAGPVIGQL